MPKYDSVAIVMSAFMQTGYHYKLYCFHSADFWSANWRAPWKTQTSRYISFFLPVTQWCYISNVLFTGGRGVSDFSVL